MCTPPSTFLDLPLTWYHFPIFFHPSSLSLIPEVTSIADNATGYVPSTYVEALLNMHVTLLPTTSRKMHECKAELICCVGYAILCSQFLSKFVQRKGPMHEPMRLASTTKTLIKYVRTRCLTAYRGHNIYCKNSPLDCMACPVFVSRTSGLARETIPVYFPTPS